LESDGSLLVQLRHAGHGLAHLFGARSDRGQRFGHSDVEGSRRAGRYMVAGRSLFQVALQVGASIFPAVDMATAKLRMTLTGMAVADKEPLLAGQRMEDLDFCEGVIRSRGRQCGSTIDRHTGTRSREQSGGRRLKVRQRRSKAWPPPARLRRGLCRGGREH
jgi:hypothetical protein